MNIRIIDKSFETTEFDKAANHPLQSWEWGDARSSMGIEVVRLGEFVGDKLTHTFQLTVHTIPLLKKKIGYLPRSINPSQAVIDFLFDYGKKNNLLFIKIEPDYSDSPLQGKSLIKSPHPLFPEWTQVLNIDSSEEELLKKMKSKTRYNIRLAEKKGVTVREESNADGFKIFSKLYFETCKRQGYFGHTQEYHQTVWNHLKNGISHILIAYYETIPLAAYELFFFHNRFYYTYGGTSELHRNIMASNLLMWEAIKLGKKLGAISLDMWGSLPPNYDQNHEWAGFTRFKEGYGTSFIRMPGSFDLVIDPVQYQLYNALYKTRQLYLSLRLKLS